MCVCVCVCVGVCVCVCVCGVSFPCGLQQCGRGGEQVLKRFVSPLHASSLRGTTRCLCEMSHIRAQRLDHCGVGNKCGNNFATGRLAQWRRICAFQLKPHNFRSLASRSSRGWRSLATIFGRQPETVLCIQVQIKSMVEREGVKAELAAETRETLALQSRAVAPHPAYVVAPTVIARDLLRCWERRHTM